MLNVQMLMLFITPATVYNNLMYTLYNYLPANLFFNVHNNSIIARSIAALEACAMMTTMMIC